MINPTTMKKVGNPWGGGLTSQQTKTSGSNCKVVSLPPVRPFKKQRDPVIASRFSSAVEAGKVKLEKFLHFSKSISPSVSSSVGFSVFKKKKFTYIFKFLLQNDAMLLIVLAAGKIKHNVLMIFFLFLMMLPFLLLTQINRKISIKE